MGQNDMKLVFVPKLREKRQTPRRKVLLNLGIIFDALSNGTTQNNPPPPPPPPTLFLSAGK